MAKLTYIVETNGENGVEIEYLQIEYVPQDVVWDSNNTFQENEELPDADSFDNPEYVRRMEEGDYAYYRRMVHLPAKSATFSLYILSDGVRINYTFTEYSDFIITVRQGDSILVKSRTNVSGTGRNGDISVVSNLNGQTLIVPLFQDYEPVRMRLLSYHYENADGDGTGLINSNTFEHTFHWLTEKTSPNKETLEVEVLSTGPRNGYIIRDVSEYAYAGELDNSYMYSESTDIYYQTVQTCDGDTLLMVDEEVIFDTSTEGVFKKVKYDNDLKIIRDGNHVRITNYGRCFLQEDAYYVITLSNVDDLEETASIVVRYEEETQSIPQAVRIEAVFSQSTVVYENDSLETLKPYLTVTAFYNDGTTNVLESDEYVLSGNLLSPSSMITVTFEELTDEFIVQVTQIELV